MKKFLYLVLPAAFALNGLALAESSQNSTVNQLPQDRIVRQVRHELLMIPQLTVFDDLSYKVEGGAVTLLGQVRNPVIKEEAQAVVKHIEGVDQVNNQIQVLPASFNDDRIRRQVARAIFSEPRLFEYADQPVPPIHIIVANGRVDLEGVVSNQGDKNVAGIRANGVSGVFAVQNDLQVETSTQARK